MNKKILLGILLIIIASLTLLTLASAAASFTASISPLFFSQSVNSTTLKIINSNTSIPLDVSFDAFSIPGESYTVNFPAGEITNISTPKELIISPTLSIDYSKFRLGKEYSTNLIVKNKINDSDNVTIPVSIQKSFCSSVDNFVNLSITSVDITNKDGDDEETDWKLLDEIEIEVEVQNQNTDESKKIDTIVQIVLYDSDGKEVLDLDKLELGKIKGGDSESKIATFKVPADLDDGAYLLYIKAYADGKEKEVCTSFFNSDYNTEITVSREDDEEKQVILTDIALEPATALCGEEVVLRAKALNVGENDQDKVKVTIYNKNLNLDQYVILSNLDMGDEADVEFTFKVPSNITETSYKLDLINLYDYDEDYKEEDSKAYDQGSKNFPAYLEVKGSCISPELAQDAEITVPEGQLDEVKAGEEVTIIATIKNTGEETTNYIISLEGNEAFSTEKDISPRTFSLAKEESKEVLITLLINKDASAGEHTFKIKALFDGEEVVTPSISLSIAESGFSITGGAIGASLKENWFIWVIVAINVILIVAIIIVAVKMSRA